MAFVMEQNIISNPRTIGVGCIGRHILSAYPQPNLIQQFWFPWLAMVCRHDVSPGHGNGISGRQISPSAAGGQKVYKRTHRHASGVRPGAVSRNSVPHNNLPGLAGIVAKRFQTATYDDSGVNGVARLAEHRFRISSWAPRILRRLRPAHPSSDRLG